MKRRRDIIVEALAFTSVGVAAPALSKDGGTMNEADFRNSDSWVRLKILGYQFPNSTEYWDANWLNVSGLCCIEGREWSFVNPCLETFELRDLTTWLDKLSKGEPVNPSCSFMEPNLQFDVLDNSTLQVCFDLECAPPWTNMQTPAAERSIRVPIGPQLAAASDVLRRQLSAFPQRGNRSEG